jgi:Domain of unknown function (DUF6285)
MPDKPDVVDLLAALAALLKEEIAPALTGRLSLQARVAATCLNIIRRELIHGPADEPAEAAGLQTLLGRTGSIGELNEELCRRIRAGELGVQDEPLMRHLWQTTLAKVRIDQPDYATYVRLSR